MKIIWDEPKRLANIEKHGFDFADIDGFDWENAIIEKSLAESGSSRFKAIGHFRNGTVAMAKAAKLKEFKPGHGYTEADWNAVDFPEMTEEELANTRPARDVLPPAFFEAINEYRKTRGRPPVDKPKKQVTLRLDEDVVERFRNSGKGWQSRINEALRKAAGI